MYSLCTDNSFFKHTAKAVSWAPGRGAAVLDDVGFVGHEVGREAVAAGAIRARHEIEIAGGGRVEDRGDGRDSRIGDRSRWQPRMLVGVVRVAAGQVGSVKGAAIVAGQQRRVDRGRVAIELHPDSQAALENGGDHGPLAGELAFLRSEEHTLNSSHLGISYAVF